jgi:ribosomal protein S18 acetylase RimI-like enzyme
MTSGDIPALQEVVDATQLFPGDMLPDMASGFLDEKGSEEIWLIVEIEGAPRGFCYAAPEQLTDGTWNLRAIAVSPSRQGGGLGAALVEALETALRADGQRILIVETSGAEQFDRTRDFYRKNGYVEEARIRDFWAAGDDKVIYWKSL